MGMYKTEIKITVLSEEPIPDDSDVADIVTEATVGEYSMDVSEISSEEISPKELAELAIAQGSDPEFFGVDADGISVAV